MNIPPSTGSKGGRISFSRPGCIYFVLQEYGIPFSLSCRLQNGGLQEDHSQSFHTSGQ